MDKSDETKKKLFALLLKEEGLDISSTRIVKSRKEKDPLPLSFAQQRLWFLDQLAPDNPFYNAPFVLRFTGMLNTTALRQSLYEIIRRHEALRTKFIFQHTQPVQQILPLSEMSPPSLPLLDLQALPRKARGATLQRLIDTEAHRPFDLTRDLLLRATLVRLEEHQHMLLLTLHHITSDGWSQGIVHGELSALYNAFVQGQPSPLTPLPIQYADFALWQHQWLQGEILERHLQYWRDQLRNLPVLELPTDVPRPAIETFQGAICYMSIPRELTQQLKELSQSAGATLFMTLLTAFATLLLHYSGQADLPIGSPIANRTQREVEGLIGFFVNTLVLRCDLTGNPPFLEALQRIREMTLEAYAHQDLPFERLVEALQPERTLRHNPLCQVLFQLQNAPRQPLSLQNLTVRHLQIDNQTARFDLVVSLIETEQGLINRWEYTTDLFTAPTIERMSWHYLHLLESIVAQPEQRLLDLPLLTKTERSALLERRNPSHVPVEGPEERSDPLLSCSAKQVYSQKNQLFPLVLFASDLRWAFRQQDPSAHYSEIVAS